MSVSPSEMAHMLMFPSLSPIAKTEAAAPFYMRYRFGLNLMQLIELNGPMKV